MLKKLHKKLLLQNSLYAKWHQNPISSLVNFLILFIFAVYVAIFMSVSIGTDINSYYAAAILTDSVNLSGDQLPGDLESCPTCDLLSSPSSLTDDLIRGPSTRPRACSNPPDLPKECKVYEGSVSDAKWLWCWAKTSNKDLGILRCLLSVGVMTGCDIPDGEPDDNRPKPDTINGIANLCKKEENYERQIDCALDYVFMGLSGDSSNVCKHHARCMKKVLEAMGIDQNFTSGLLLSGSGIIGHVWNEVNTVGGGAYYIDSYNKIKFWCPSGVITNPNI